MSKKTESETLLESFCEENGIAARRVYECQSQRPDYELKLNESRLIVEVKQFDPNEDERKAIEKEARGEKVALGGKPGDRVRRAIRSANKQLRSLLHGDPVPTLLVVFNNTPCSLHTQPYAITTAIKGLDVVELHVPASLDESPQFGDTVSGPESTMRPDANTSTSAVGVLERDEDDNLRLTIYHNPHASCALDPEKLRLPTVRHFRIAPGARNSLEANWCEA